jgi:PhnB protein
VIRIGDSMVMISNGNGLREAVSAFLYVYVENVDETYQRAVEAEAESLEIPSDLPYGDKHMALAPSEKIPGTWKFSAQRIESLLNGL